MKGLIDSTLREGGQSVGVVFSFVNKLEIITRLVRLGIEEIELGVVNRRDNELAALMRAARDVAGNSRIGLWSRCNQDDIDLAASLQPDVLSLSIPASDLHLKKKLGRSRAWAEQCLADSVVRAKSSGIPYISVGFEDATRADRDFIVNLAEIAERAGADRVRLADTVGVASPGDMKNLIVLLQAHTGLEIGVHTHNDFGMATANAVTALESGADWADVTVLGLGERAGNARLEEVAGFLVLQSGRKAYRVSELAALCKMVADAARMLISPRHPLIGENIFSCETGLHLQGLLREPSTYEPYSPDQVGKERKLLFGQKIGRRALMEYLVGRHIHIGESRLDDLLARLLSRARLAGQPFGAADLAEILADS